MGVEPRRGWENLRFSVEEGSECNERWKTDGFQGEKHPSSHPNTSHILGYTYNVKTNNMTDEHKKKNIEDEGHDATRDELLPLEPATGAAENSGPSEEELPDAPDDVEENLFPSAPMEGTDLDTDPR
jgi:hypothetical protein